jgi:hypothetical protein
LEIVPETREMFGKSDAGRRKCMEALGKRRHA